MRAPCNRSLASVYDRPPFVCAAGRVLSSGATSVGALAGLSRPAFSRAAPCRRRLSSISAVGRLHLAACQLARPRVSIHTTKRVAARKKRGRLLASSSSTRPAFISRSLLGHCVEPAEETHFSDTPTRFLFYCYFFFFLRSSTRQLAPQKIPFSRRSHRNTLTPIPRK